ncbi:hypothetical protein KO561_15085 [Radiobacillus kanasensis]|uniref:hypothetical protein n=1 Tax=Radiobacillus kanasensis TaxID=2844358 RepID=UPI001E5D0412|nr:hypothetical protein [Radiobacillus kanasensis]UFT98509.1 hypothetical protein KO561_15085 [Radiobacillus kanasensis]
MNKLVHLLHRNGSMQKKEILQALNWSPEEFLVETSKLKEQKWLIEVAPHLFALTSKSRQILKEQSERKEEQRKQEQIRRKVQQESFKANVLAQLQQRVNELEQELRMANTKIQTLVEENKRLRMESKPKEIRPVRPQTPKSTAPSYPSPQMGELGMWLDLGQAEHERKIIEGEYETDPTYDRNSPLYQDDEERYFQRVRDGEE